MKSKVKLWASNEFTTTTSGGEKLLSQFFWHSTEKTALSLFLKYLQLLIFLTIGITDISSTLPFSWSPHNSKFLLFNFVSFRCKTDCPLHALAYVVPYQWNQDLDSLYHSICSMRSLGMRQPRVVIRLYISHSSRGCIHSFIALSLFVNASLVRMLLSMRRIVHCMTMTMPYWHVA